MFAFRTLIKYYISALVTVVGNVVIAQQIDVVFNTVSYDMGVIAEDEGLVGFIFSFINNSDYPVKVDSAMVSCGCIVPKWDTQPVLPGDSGVVSLIYNPAGRPGKFSKSLTIFLRSRADLTLRYLNIKGVVIEAEKAEALRKEYLDEKNQEYEFQIKPISLGMVKIDSFDIATSGFNQFLNDLTFVIDQEGFVNVTLEFNYFGNAAAGKPANQVVTSIAKNAIINGLLNRGYREYNAGITTLPIKISTEKSMICSECIGILTLRSTEYNNDFINESIIRPERDKAIPKQKLTINDSIFKAKKADVYINFETNPKDFKSKTFKDNYEKFIHAAVISYLEKQEITLGLKLCEAGDKRESVSINKAFQSVSNKLKKEISVSLVSEGVAEENIHYLPTKNIIVSNDTMKKGVTKYDFVQMAIYSTKDSLQPEEFNPEEKPKPDYVKLPHDDFPVYKISFSGSSKKINIVDDTFIALMTKIKKATASGKKIHILIESSASKTPTQDIWDNHYIAQKRAQNTKQIILDYLIIVDALLDNIVIDEPVFLVQGPEYRRDIYPIGFYKQFQYLKIIAYYEPESNKATKGVLPYMINYPENESGINLFSLVFDRMVESLVPVIEEQGFIKIIVEASSSTIPAKEYHSNDILSFYRGKDATDRLLSALQQKGVNPSRVIVVAQRALVQGPRYENNTDVELTNFRKYQYIKIIPECLLNN